jgi:hypothetical protein
VRDVLSAVGYSSQKQQEGEKQLHGLIERQAKALAVWLWCKPFESL